MTVDVDDTIVAIASANGVGQRGIVRLSGPQAIDCARKVFETEISSSSPSQISVQLHLGEGLKLDGQLLFWPTNKSYTRQPSAEFHTIGSKPLLDLSLQKFCENGCRIARPGEFTLRAFLGGRLDLTQAEAVLAVIDSTERKQFEIALQQLAGGLANPLSQIRERLIDLLAELEAGLDFVEEDIEFVSNDEVVTSVDECLSSVLEIQNQIGSRETREAVHSVVLVGWPNVGKSSLFNAMLGKDRAIVADLAGTTRDYVSANVERGGLQIRLLDTAGLDSILPEPGRPSGESSARGDIESAAQKVSLDQLYSADLRLLCLDSNRSMNAAELRLLETLGGLATRVVLTKCDLHRQAQFEGDYCLTCALPGQYQGIDGLWDSICNSLAESATSDSAVVGSTLSRCREHLGEVLSGLAAGKDAAIAGAGEEIIAAELRHALEQLGQIVGTVYTDDILDRIFGRFCIGK